MESEKLRKSSSSSKDSKDSKDETYCGVCQTTISDSTRHYASLQHAIKRNMRHEEKTLQKGLKKVSMKRRAYKDAMRKANLFNAEASDDSDEESERRSERSLGFLNLK